MMRISQEQQVRCLVCYSTRRDQTTIYNFRLARYKFLDKGDGVGFCIVNIHKIGSSTTVNHSNSSEVRGVKGERDRNNNMVFWVNGRAKSRNTG